MALQFDFPIAVAVQEPTISRNDFTVSRELSQLLAHTTVAYRYIMQKDDSLIESHVRFFHPVGQSTLKQGITVPLVAQKTWLKNIKKGQSIAVEIRFGKEQSVIAMLRRINNDRGHLQFRYESKQQSLLRNYLKMIYGEKPNQDSAILEILEIGPQTFLFSPLASSSTASPKLSVYRPYYHQLNEEDVLPCGAFRELCGALSLIEYGQNHYNSQIRDTLIASGWRKEPRIHNEIGLRCDFEKDGIWVEVEFGNARVYYQNYVKFLLAMRYQKARFGVLLCPTNAFAQLLCEIGQKRALDKVGRDSSRTPNYSGMMNYEKAVRELPLLGFIINGGVVIAGIDVQQGQRS